jgi:hypothetical protein
MIASPLFEKAKLREKSLKTGGIHVYFKLVRRFAGLRRFESEAEHQGPPIG